MKAFLPSAAGPEDGFSGKNAVRKAGKKSSENIRGKEPLISVCIPVYETEKFLALCLRSLCLQDFENFEILVASDKSPGKDEKGRSAKKISALAKKECRILRKKAGLSPVEIRFFEHSENRGCVEIRRTLVFQARGKYITMLDSDDCLKEGALSSFYQAAQNYQADIVHARFLSGTFDQEGLFTPSKVNKCGKIFIGSKSGREILSSWLSGLYNGNVCGKLILRELYLKAFENIPYTECNMADDFLIYFFVAITASTYVGIDQELYLYRIDSGMSSVRKIESLERWRMICSASGVFTVISSWLKENDFSLSQEEKKDLGELALFYVANNLNQLKCVLAPEIKEDGMAMLKDYWGQHLVGEVENAMAQKEKVMARKEKVAE